MKKKSTEDREACEVSKQKGDYAVGQVSGSLFPQKSTSGSSVLSALFSTGSSAPSLLFVPAPKPVPKAPETSSEDTASTSPKVQTLKKVTEKKKTAAEKVLEKRESALQNADEEDGVKRSTSKKTKRKATGTTEGAEGDEQEPAQKKKRINRAEERIKNKRTVRKVHPKRQSINAYVVFTAADGAMNALQRNGLEIEKGFHIRVDRASKSGSHDHKRSIFVGNLPYDVNEEPLRAHFEECGKVEAVRLVRDKNSGMGKGFGYVLFESIDSVQLALKLDSSEFEGRKIRVKRSVKKEKQKKVATGKGPNARATKSPNKGGAPAKASGKGTGPGERGQKKGFKGRPGQGPRNKSSAPPSQHRPGKTQGGTFFKGEMATPGGQKPKQGKGLKKKFKPRKRDKAIHI
ncbi:hypothetical protein JZ751_024224 [Albula glossodonta]|uniref:RRM domain-containing protein n=1 Tax=Albula glossodonta TaxID=121402 RepID=A0A8T2NFI7_9TELE|nr:hypothetical protein JZ751_024224 [Albula glossodonta]